MTTKPHKKRGSPRLSRALRALLVATLIATVVLGAMVVRYEYLIQSRTSALLIQQRVENAERTLTDFFRPLVNSLLVIRDWGSAGQIDLEKPGELKGKLQPVCSRLLPISSLEIAGTDGRTFWLVKDQTGCRKEPLPEGYLPSKTPWFEGALHRPESDPFYWSRPSVQPSTGAEGATLSVAWRPAALAVDSVAALHVPRDTLDELSLSLPAGERGEVFWVNDKGELTQPRAQALQLPPSGQLVRMVQTLQEAGDAITEPVTFQMEGETWWFAEVTALLDSRTIRIGLALPQEELVADLRDQELVLLYVLAGLLVMGVGLVVSLVWLRRLNVGTSVRPAGYRSAGAEELQTLISGGEGVAVEFKSTMRWNLNQDRPGKEVEFSWLRTVVAFLNSGGGTLLIGVDDTGTLVGIEADRFPNEDKYLLHFNNLLHEHVGLEFSSKIAFELRDVEGKTILVVDCEVADQAVFLKKGKVEEFLIRVGPGNRQLPPSKVLEYMAGRS